MNTVILISFLGILIALAVGYIVGHERGYQEGCQKTENSAARRVARLLRDREPSPFWRN